MPKITMAAAALLLAAALPAAAARGASEVDPIFSAWNSDSTPGCAVAVARNGRTVLERAYGSADLEHDVPIRTDTIFEAGSVSKQFTAAAILLLAADGKLSLKDDVRKYVPELPEYPHKITLEHLMNHTSGLRDWGVVAEISGWPRGSRAHTNADALAIAARQRSLNYAPGAEYSYTNTGYNLMAIIVERVSGSPLAEFSRERLFKPLGMANTSWRSDFRKILKRRSVAYAKTESGYAQDMPFENAHGNGGLLTTAGDLLIWDRALASGRLGRFVTAELHRRSMLSYGREIPYARGIVVGRHKGREEVQHAGATGGYRAWLGRYPAHQLSVALLCNAGEVAAIDVGRRVAEQFLPPGQPKPAAAALPAKARERAGLWVNQRTGIPVTLVSEGERLRVKEGPFLEPLSASRLRLGSGELAFEGQQSFLFHNVDGEAVRFRRAAPARPSARELAALTGRYRSEEADATYRVERKDGGLVLQHDRRLEATVKLLPAYKDAFSTPNGIVRFYRDGKGRVVALGIGAPRVRDLRFRRL